MSEMKDGRFRGDIHAELTRDPAQRRAYRVRVWVWDWRETWAGGKPVEELTWVRARGERAPHNEPKHQSDFKSLERAVKCLYEARAHGALIEARSKIHESAESRREFIA